MPKKRIPPEELPEEEIREEIEKEFKRWDQIAKEGCSDPFWPDGTNMNLVRNHIIYWRNILKTKMDMQLSLFGEDGNIPGERPIPPKMPEDYMAPGGTHSDRLDNKRSQDTTSSSKETEEVTT